MEVGPILFWLGFTFHPRKLDVIVSPSKRHHRSICETTAWESSPAKLAPETPRRSRRCRFQKRPTPKTTYQCTYTVHDSLNRVKFRPFALFSHPQRQRKNKWPPTGRHPPRSIIMTSLSADELTAHLIPPARFWPLIDGRDARPFCFETGESAGNNRTNEKLRDFGPPRRSLFIIARQDNGGTARIVRSVHNRAGFNLIDDGIMWRVSSGERVAYRARVVNKMAIVRCG